MRLKWCFICVEGRLYIICIVYNFLCRAQLTVVPKSSMPVASITAIKVGTGKLDQCISIISEEKTLVVKIEDSKHFKQIVDGFVALTDDNKKKRNAVERQTVAL